MVLFNPFHSVEVWALCGLHSFGFWQILHGYFSHIWLNVSIKTKKTNGVQMPAVWNHFSSLNGGLYKEVLHEDYNHAYDLDWCGFNIHLYFKIPKLLEIFIEQENIFHWYTYQIYLSGGTTVKTLSIPLLVNWQI